MWRRKWLKRRTNESHRYANIYIYINTYIHIYAHTHTIWQRYDTFIAKFSKFQQQQPQRISKINQTKTTKCLQKSHKDHWQPTGSQSDWVATRAQRMGGRLGSFCVRQIWNKDSAKQQQRSAAHTENDKSVERASELYVLVHTYIIYICSYVCMCLCICTLALGKSSSGI